MIDEPRKHSSKKRRQANGYASEGSEIALSRARRSVIVWDLDETLIIFNSILDRSFEPVDDPSTNRTSRPARALPAKESEFALLTERERLAREWERIILQVCDEYFFFSSIEDCTEAAVGDLAEFDDGANLDAHDFENDNISELSASSPVYKRLLAYRLRKALERYALGGHGLLADQPELRAQWEALYRATDAFTQGWLSAGVAAVTGAPPGAAAGAEAAGGRAGAAADAAAAVSAGVPPGPRAQGRPGARTADGVRDRVPTPASGSTSDPDATPTPAETPSATTNGTSGKRRLRRDSLDDEDGDPLGLFGGEGDGDGDGDGEASDGGGGGGGRRRWPAPPEVVNVLVTAGCLLPTLAKLVLFKLDRVFPLTHVYSARRDGKEQCFRRILQQYGLEPLQKAAEARAAGGEDPKGPPGGGAGSGGGGGGGGGGAPGRGAGGAAEAKGAAEEAEGDGEVETRFLAIGDGPEEAAAAARLGWGCVRIAPLHGEGAVPIFSLSPDVLERKIWA